jgi:hypothetical protein
VINLQKVLSPCLLATAALLAISSFANANGPLGAASEIAVLGGTSVTCTGGSVVGNVGVSPGSAASYTNTGCTIAGGAPPATDQSAAQARADLLGEYARHSSASASCISVTGSLAAGNLKPGAYCVDAVPKTGLLTLTGPSNGVWTFLVDGSLTGTNFSVEMAGGGQPCNVYWVPRLAATLTTSSLKGNILAGDDTLGSVTLTGGSLAGNAFANIAVTMTGTSLIGCRALQASK